MRLLTSLLYGLIGLNAVLGATASVAFHYDWAAGIAVAIAGALVVIGAAFKLWRATVAWAGILAIGGGALMSLDVAGYADLSRRAIIRDLAVRDAPSYPDAGGFVFRDGAVRGDLWGEVTRPGKTSRDFSAAPVVPEGWTSDAPITVWAVCEEIYGCARAWEQPLRAGVRPTGPPNEYLAKAIADAESRRGLTSAPGAILIHWVPSPDGVLAETRDRAWLGFQVWNVTLIVTTLAAAAIAAWRRRRAATPPASA